MAVHPRLSVNSLSSLYQPLSADLALWRDLEVSYVGLISPKLAADGWKRALDTVTDAGLRVSNISTENEVIAESLRFAASVGASTVYACTGPGGARTWEDSAKSFCATVAPLASLAGELGVVLAVEPTNPLRTDISFVYTLRDAFDLARDAGLGVVLDFYSCWYERNFDELVRKNIEAVALVQVCDYLLGTFDTPNRVVPGDGDIPLARLLTTLLEAGYRGAFDLEVLGPRIEDEGYPSAVRRSVERMNEILVEVGA
jgi:sugar phosphate isomerase/epimerase